MFKVSSYLVIFLKILPLTQPHSEVLRAAVSTHRCEEGAAGDRFSPEQPDKEETMEVLRAWGGTPGILCMSTQHRLEQNPRLGGQPESSWEAVRHGKAASHPVSGSGK